MINALRSEITKLLTLRSTWVWAILLTGSLYGPVVLIGLFSGEASDYDWGFALPGAMIFVMLAVSFSASAMAGEFNDRMHAQAFLTQPRRSLWFNARTLVISGFLLINYLVGVGLIYLVFLVFPKITLVNEKTVLILVDGVLFLVFSFIAIGVAALTRNRVAAMAVPLAWFLAIERLITVAASQIAAFMPLWLVTAGERVSQLAKYRKDNAEFSSIGWDFMDVQPLGYNIGIIVAWTVVSLLLGLWINAKRDVR
ncbi:ABC transporter permease [Corynebacterium pseudotuberculosis]|uniref:ABC transporter permease n=2 Tax=Corynebacterium pseudotuberculosis TaxID=1719 RepID=UPI0002324721|nr:ABC transporter permease [Corynebacterium pseudotuberculosis]AER68424.1 ABC transporter inner membrane protein [Corynebacterium pseudotuberculosis 1/06-A]AFB71667.1 ABC transporter permease [Corynebacterium pseudotuberculosis 316]AMN69413.1 ABC transporter permease [Corynebacterium pseudotuberculosis]AMN71258.1 ABC transporter permease [Corynebacterium pseudotuberculosis]AMN74095.1 ABC transporter permease [Corynebacterium pseudotuberculosis]